MLTNTILAAAIKSALLPSTSLIEMLLESSSTFYSESKKDTDFEELAKRAKRMELEMKLAESQAHVAQELAIAARIERAEEVEVEEFYEYAAEGKAGAQFDSSSVNLGLSGSTKRVSRRICRFKGGLVSDTKIDLGVLETESDNASDSLPNT